MGVPALAVCRGCAHRAVGAARRGGRLAGRLARRLLPRLARRLIEAAIGVSLATGSVGTALPALAAAAGPLAPVAASTAGLPTVHGWPDLDRSTAGAHVVRPRPAPAPVLAPAAPTRPSAPAARPTPVLTPTTAPGTAGKSSSARAPSPTPAAARHPPRSADPHVRWPDLDRPASRDQRPTLGPRRHLADAEVVVRGGDTLWAIAARHLGPDAADDRIAEEWPRWFAANRHVVGADPDLIRPGQRLRPPPAGS